MSLQENILSLLNDEAKIVDAQWVEDMQQRYPYFSLPAMLMLKRNGEIDSELRQKLAQNLALNASDRDALSLVVDVDGDYWAHFYPQEERQPQVSTNDAISTFLDNYGTNDPKEDELLERLIFNPTPDYAQLLAKKQYYPEYASIHNQPQLPRYILRRTSCRLRKSSPSGLRPGLLRKLHRNHPSPSSP